MVYQPDATGRQKDAIAKLCIALKIREPVEDRPMSKGEAGKVIRELALTLRTRRS